MAGEPGYEAASISVERKTGHDLILDPNTNQYVADTGSNSISENRLYAWSDGVSIFYTHSPMLNEGMVLCDNTGTDTEYTILDLKHDGTFTIRNSSTIVYYAYKFRNGTATYNTRTDKWLTPIKDDHRGYVYTTSSNLVKDLTTFYTTDANTTEILLSYVDKDNIYISMNGSTRGNGRAYWCMRDSEADITSLSDANFLTISNN